MNNLKRILLIEDSKNDQFFFIHALDRIENAVIYGVANNGKEALEGLNDPDDLPDMIFIDINMPVMNGIECLCEIKKNPLTKNIPVVILSSDSRGAELVGEFGAKAFVRKPGDCGQLQEQLEQLINLDFSANSQICNQTNSNSTFVDLIGI